MKTYTVEHTNWEYEYHTDTITKFASSDIAEALTYYEQCNFRNPKKWDENYVLVEWEGSTRKDLYLKTNYENDEY